MALFNCIPPVTGNLGPVVIYQMHGRYFMRTTSSLTRERVQKYPAFGRTRELAGLLAMASRMASRVYGLLPAEKKAKGLYRTLTGEAMYWLCNQWTAAEVMEYLQRMYLRPTGVRRVKAKAPVVAIRPSQSKGLVKKAIVVPLSGKLATASQSTSKQRLSIPAPGIFLLPVRFPANSFRSANTLLQAMQRGSPVRMVAGIESS